MRKFTSHASGDARAQLGVLTDAAAAPAQYREAMRRLGEHLAAEVIAQDSGIKGATVCVACTVEDADFLARGVLDGFIRGGVDASQVKLVCFWNERVRDFNGDSQGSFDVAPIVKEYREPVDLRHSVVVVVKSIISGACVVKTNLASLIDEVVPQRVIVVAPVMLEGAPARLSSEFPTDTSKLFEYFTFAIDDERDAEHNVVPGIGGSVYTRLGVEDKTAYVPDLVKQRRRTLMTA